MNVITLMTDFGARDWFVGAMKGVILGIHPRVTLVDIGHEIPAGDIRAGAFALAAAGRFFPKGTIHVAVVDPGVGSARRAIVVQTTDYCFVGPDNGVLSWALAKEEIKAIRALENENCFLHPVSRTFHGRDIFAPVAAHLSRGFPLRKLGPALKDFVRLDWPEPRQESGQVQGEVIHLDLFGNAITNIASSMLQPLGTGALHVFLGRKRLCPIAACYQSVPSGCPVAVSGSSGFLEIAVNGGSAAQRFGLRIGHPVAVRLG